MSIGSKEQQQKDKETLNEIMLEIEKDQENWVKCSDEEPVDYDSYLTSYKGTICISHYNINGWHNDNLNYVDYWRELPEPPKQ